MDRTPAPLSPLSCYGLEQGPDNPKCPNCPHREPCADLMEHLAGRVNVDEVRFRLVPEMMVRNFEERYKLSIDEVYRADLDRSDIEKVYAFCHHWVTGHWPRNSIGKYKEKVLHRAVEAQVSLRLFITANIFGWKQTAVGNRPFDVTLLTRDQSVNVVREYSKVCHARYGTFDSNVLAEFMGEPDTVGWVEEKLYHSEVIAGQWLISYNLFQSGNVKQKFYRDNEQALSPYWLAVEGTYWDTVYRDYINQPPDPSLHPQILRLRFDVAQVLGRLKNRPRDGLHVFIARERIMARAVREVLSRRHLSPSDFKINGTAPVTNAFKFWMRLASAIQQYECLNFVDKLPSGFDVLQIGSGN